MRLYCYASAFHSVGIGVCVPPARPVAYRLYVVSCRLQQQCRHEQCGDGGDEDDGAAASPAAPLVELRASAAVKADELCPPCAQRACQQGDEPAARQASAPGRASEVEAACDGLQAARAAAWAAQSSAVVLSVVAARVNLVVVEVVDGVFPPAVFAWLSCFSCR